LKSLQAALHSKPSRGATVVWRAALRGMAHLESYCVEFALCAQKSYGLILGRCGEFFGKSFDADIDCCGHDRFTFGGDAIAVAAWNFGDQAVSAE
jgi:hypothetical protein